VTTHLGSPQSAREALRLATTDVHERLHVATPFRKIAEGALDMGDYVALLRSIFRFHAAVQPVLSTDPVTAPLNNSERVEQLRKDLLTLCADFPATPPEWTPGHGGHAALGCLYVVQGSTIGGRVIYRQLDYLFGRSSEGRAFFAGSVNDPQRWMAVRAFLEQSIDSPDRLDRMVEGAQATFTLFESCLEQGLKENSA